MKRPFGFDSAIDEANRDDGFANMSISKELILELDNYICQLEVKCDATQPRKTVSDAVDWSESGNNISGWSVKFYDVLIFRENSKNYSFVSAISEAGKGLNEQCQVVCTRKEFEAEVERRKGEEWTHVDQNNHKCKIIHTDDMFSWVKYEAGNHCVVGNAFISKRKPTISKADIDAVKAWYAWLEDNDKSGLTSDLIEEYISEHEVK